MLDLSELPLKQNAVNVLGTESGKENETNTMTRKIEFDRGIPQSFDFASNDVKTIDYQLHSILLFKFKKIFSIPLNLFMLFLIIFYTIAYIVIPDKLSSLDLSVTFYVHIVIMGLEIFYEIYNLWQIWRNDSKTNSQTANIYDMEHRCFVTATWGDIRVGHIIKVNKDEIVPADIIVLETMDSTHKCYVDVSAITGVFDSFIIKKACIDTQTPSMKSVKFNEYVKNIKGMLKYEEPNCNIHSFTGRLKLESFPRASDVNEENFVMRGSTVKNIKYVYGLVVYTGMETKIMQIIKSDKQSKFIVKKERNVMNNAWRHLQYIVIGIYVLMILMLTLSLIHKTYMSELMLTGNVYYVYMDFFYSLVQFLLTFHFIVPFNWFNLLVLAFYLLSLFIKWDLKVKQKAKYTVDIINTDCLQDFGQVKYILADKTGTLTDRKFILKACSIQGKIFTFDPLERKDENYIFRMKNYDITDLELYQELKSNSSFSPVIKTFFEYLCVCHNVKIRSNQKNENNHPDRVFSSSYAEEKSVLNMMKNFNYCVTKTKMDRITVEINGESKNYHIVGCNKYSDERKRMSVILKKYRDDHESILLCKGSDLSIFRKINVTPESEKDLKMVIDQIKKFSSIGYRYFVFCKRDLTEDETGDYMTKYKSAENYVLYQDAHFSLLAEEYEVNMELVGVLFFEEKVSADLRYSISKLNNAQINTWIVSGDKKDNVMAVSKNLDMFKNNSMTVEFSDKDDLDDLDIKMNMFLLQVLGTGGNMMKMKTRQGVNINVETSQKSSKTKELTMLIHGSCFNVIYNDTRLFQCFSTLLSFTNNLFAYSFTPHHKYLLCHTVKSFITKNSKVLAIGDGLNDFMMLKEADLSIGIRSREILQVRNTCDVIVSKFPQIVDLILVHGTWNMKRIYKICFCSIYANFLIIFPFFFQQRTHCNGSCFFETDYTKLTVDILVINLAISLVICFDQFIERPLIGLNSNVYQANFKDKNDVIISFVNAVSKAIIDSGIIYYSFILLGNYTNILGQDADLGVIGYVILHTCYTLIFFKLFALRLNNINIMSIVVSLVSIGGIIGTVFIDTNTTIVCYQTLSYLSIILCSIFAISLSYLYEKLIHSAINVISPRFIHNIALKFKTFVENYILFINFEDVLKEIAQINTKKPLASKISYHEVIQKIYIHNNNNVDPVLDNMTDINNDKMVSLKIYKPFLKFHDEKLENDYMNHFKGNIQTSFICYLITMAIFWTADIIIRGVYSTLKDQTITKALMAIYILSGFILLIKPLRVNFFNNYSIYFYIGIIIEIICIYVEKSDNDTKVCLEMFITFSFPLLFANRKFKLMIYGVMIYYSAILPSVFLNNFGFDIEFEGSALPMYANLPLLYHRGLFILGIFGIMIIYGYFEELSSRISFLKYNKKTMDYKKDSEIYNNLVPEFIREKMKNGVRGAAAIDYEVVTILFCDISDFDKLVATMAPKDLINLLDRIYNTFDQLCSLHGLQKIETVGKTYMAAGGLKETEKDVDPLILQRHHAIRSFELAKDMLDVMQTMTLENGERVPVKIGLHTGKVIAAVVGNHKPQFSLIGDTINTTARMCAYSQDNAINCSQYTYEHLFPTYTDCTVSVKEVKGKGTMNLYLYKPFVNKQPVINSSIVNSQNKRLTTGMKKISNMAFVRQSSRVDRNLNRQNSKLSVMNMSQRSVFIYENSMDMPEDLKSVVGSNSVKKKPTHLSKMMTKLPIEGVHTESVDKNTIFSESFLFFKFNAPVAQDLYAKFSAIKLESAQTRAKVINYVYIVIMGIGIYDLTDNIDSRTTASEIAFLSLKIFFLICLKFLNDKITLLQEKRPHLLQVLTIGIYLIFTILLQVQMSTVADPYLVNLIMEQNLTILAVTYTGVLSYSQNACNLVAYIITFVINLGVNNSSPLYVKYLIFESVICLIIFVFLVTREYVSTFEYLQNRNENEKLKTIEKLLFNLMPQHVVQNLKEDIPVADVLYNVTMLFADIVRFTDYSSQREPVQVVNMLTELFREFDDACQRYNVYKVHTIGDCYVVMSFTGKVPLNERNYKEEARNIVNMAESMIETIKVVRRDVNFEELNMRIGIHTGTVIAGIIGTKVVRYDIFGSDVYIANKMESGGDAGKINISEDTRLLLETESGNNKEYEFIPNKVIPVPSVGREINSYFIERRIINRNESNSNSG